MRMVFYAVYRDEYEAEYWYARLRGVAYRIACFGAFSNAVEIWYRP